MAKTMTGLLLGLVASLEGAHAQLPVTSNLHAWYKADAGVTVIGGYVTQWADQSGNGFTLTPPATGPTVTPNAVNALPAISFDGSTQLNGNFGVTPFTSATIFAIFRYTVTGSDNDYLYTFGTDGASGSQMTFSRQTLSRAYHYDGSIKNFGKINSLPANQWLVSSQVYNTEPEFNHVLFLNGSGVVRTTSSNPYSANVSTGVIGNWSSGSHRFIGDLVELLIYDSPLSEAERTSVDNYLRERAGLPEFFKSEAEILSQWDVIQYDLNGQPNAVWTFDLV